MKAQLKADWLSVAEAARTVLSAVTPLPFEDCPLESALGRVLADDLMSPIDLPLWTNSAMDGFAVHAKDVEGASDARPVELPVEDDIPAGGFPRGPLRRGAAARVMTGAPVPDGADSVIRVEHTDAPRAAPVAPARVRINNDQDAGRNLRRAGEDLGRGEVALSCGSPVTPGAIGVAAAIGRQTVSVHRRPRVALLGSGDELVPMERFEEVLEGRRIVSSNTYMLAAQLREVGCEVRDLGIAADSIASVREHLENAAGCDALVTCAGVSVGAHDHLQEVLLALGAEIRFWRVRMRPGSPFTFALVPGLGGIPWFGLPGNPVSAFVTFEVFVRPALLRMLGRANVFPRTLEARLLNEYTSPAGLTQFLRVRLHRHDDVEWHARLTGPQGSGILSSLGAADGLLIVPASQPGARAGERLMAIPLPSIAYVEQLPYEGEDAGR